MPLCSGGRGITTTSEWLPAERANVTYNTTCEVRRVNSDVIDITLTYEHSRNTHISLDDALWGRSVLRVGRNASDGEATWHDSDDNSYDGAVRWKRLPSGLFKDAKREYYSRLQREQDTFRSMLLAFDGCCVVSKEATPEALEAAHVIPSKERGAEVAGNGILLRSDLHRLYDCGYFAIDPDGNIRLLRDVSAYYRSLLDGVRLPEEVAARVKAALKVQWEKISADEF